jgi:hypothetical protein
MATALAPGPEGRALGAGRSEGVEVEFRGWEEFCSDGGGLRGEVGDGFGFGIGACEGRGGGALLLLFHPFRGRVDAHADGAGGLRGVAAVAAGVVAARVLVWSLAGIAEDVDGSVYLGVVVHNGVMRHAGETQLCGLQVHGMADQVVVVGLEDELALCIRKDLFAVLEKDVKLLEEMSCGLYVDGSTAAVIITDRLFQNSLDTPRLQVCCIWAEREFNSGDIFRDVQHRWIRREERRAVCGWLGVSGKGLF